MRELLRLVVIIAIAVIVGVNLANTFRPLLFLWYGTTDFVTQSEERLSPLLQNLPPTGEIGYVSDTPPGDATIDPEAVKKFYLMQYALAPRVVIATPTPKLPLTVGDFNRLQFVATPHSGSVQDVGGGVVIIRQTEQ